MKVRCKQENRFLIKDELYEVINISPAQEVDIFRYVYSINESSDTNPVRHTNKVSYQLKNHTDKKWTTTWYFEANFYSREELRNIKIEEILK